MEVHLAPDGKKSPVERNRNLHVAAPLNTDTDTIDTIAVDSIESVDNETEKVEKEKSVPEKKKKVSPKIFLKEKATSALNKIKNSRDGESVAMNTRNALQPVAGRTRSKKSAAATKPKYK